MFGHRSGKSRIYHCGFKHSESVGFGCRPLCRSSAGSESDAQVGGLSGCVSGEGCEQHCCLFLEMDYKDTERII